MKLWPEGLVVWSAVLLAAWYSLGASALAVVASFDPLSGGAGWVGAGLLGGVLAWLLLKHLPDKDKQFNRLVKDCETEKKDIITNYNQTISEISKKFVDQFQTQREDFQKALTFLSDQQRRHVDDLINALLKEWRSK